MSYWNPKLLEQLLEVQDIDIKIRALLSKIGELNRRSKEEDPEIIRLKSELAICEENITTTEAQQQMYMDTLEDIHTAIKGLATTKSGAFKPRTRSSTEALRIEEEKLAALHDETSEQIRLLNAQRQEVQERIKTRAKEVESILQGPEAEIRKLKGKQRRFDKLRDEAAKGIPDSLMRKYDRLRSSRSGIGLTIMRDGVCTVCRMQMPTAVVSRLLNGGRVPVCPACGRMVTKVENSEELLNPKSTTTKKPARKTKAKKTAAKAKVAAKQSSPPETEASKPAKSAKRAKPEAKAVKSAAAAKKETKKTPAKVATKKSAEAKAPAQKEVKAKSAAKKPPAKKAADKATTEKKPTAKKKTEKKPAAKKAAGKKTVTKKAPAKKPVVKKGATKKVTTKAAAKKAPAKKPPAKKTAEKKAPPKKKTSAKKPTKKSAPKAGKSPTKAPAKKSKSKSTKK